MNATSTPIEYVENEAWFCGRRFFVDENVLIPRPETAQIIELVTKITEENRSVSNILDVGTGSGCIAITLKLEKPHLEITACDISKPALLVAQKNWKILGETGGKITFVQSDLLENITSKFDIIAANLPYVDKTWPWVDEKSLAPEPSLALYADDGGLALIKKLIRQAPKHLANKGYLVLEADPCQHTAIVKFATEHGLDLASRTEYALLLRKVQSDRTVASRRR